MTNIVRIETNRRNSKVVVYNGIAYLQGMTPEDRSVGIQGQTEQTLAKIDRYLAEVGSSKAQILTAQIWLKNIGRDFDAMNEIWNAWTAPGASPARATAQCEMASPDILIEIVVTAAAPNINESSGAVPRWRPPAR